jgi:hypothetical protein
MIQYSSDAKSPFYNGRSFLNGFYMKIIPFKWLIGFFTTVALATIIFFFSLSFIEPAQGPLYIIYAACALIFIGTLFVMVHFLERKNDAFQYALVHLHRYLSFSIRIFLTVLSILTLIGSFILFIITSQKEYFINCGCFIAFIMIIILIELFIRILLPLAGLDQNF